jgi:hypothetical protein|tara:strand:+ start:3015 stop:3545 length:531 start_codon:yes stop_codon:yes gene_type:complete
MSLNFDNMMKKFYDDPKLGLIPEDAPTNNAGSGAVSMPPDVRYQKDKKKKEKKPYDARTKPARAFYKRMTDLKARREMRKQSKLAAKVLENTLNRENEYLLAEDNIDVLKSIVKNKQNKSIKFKDGAMKVDLYTASAVTQVFDLVNKSNKDKLSKLINGKKAEFLKVASFAMSKVK